MFGSKQADGETLARLTRDERSDEEFLDAVDKTAQLTSSAIPARQQEKAFQS